MQGAESHLQHMHEAEGMPELEDDEDDEIDDDIDGPRPVVRLILPCFMRALLVRIFQDVS
jgi:hypothetical protein